METKLENSVNSFAGRQTPVPLAALSTIVLICLTIACVLAVMTANWPMLVVLGLGMIAFAVFLAVTGSERRRANAARDDRKIDWRIAIPEVQKTGLNLEVSELSRILEVEPEQISDLQAAYIVAEDLALRQIQHEEKVPLLRHVTVGDASFDAVFVKNGTLVCAETSFLVAPDVRGEKVDAILKKAALVKDRFAQQGIEMGVRLMLILITQLTPEDDVVLRQMLDQKKFSATPVDIDIRFLDFEALQRIYITE